MNDSEKKHLFEAAEKVWELSWTQYFRPETHLFYKLKEPSCCA